MPALETGDPQVAFAVQRHAVTVRFLHQYPPVYQGQACRHVENTGAVKRVIAVQPFAVSAEHQAVGKIDALRQQGQFAVHRQAVKCAGPWCPGFSDPFDIAGAEDQTATCCACSAGRESEPQVLYLAIEVATQQVIGPGQAVAIRAAEIAIDQLLVIADEALHIPG